jgi:predicted nucleic acid-binding Zn ribbon protein
MAHSYNSETTSRPITSKSVTEVPSRPCDVCFTPVPREKNSIVCSDECQNVRLKIFELERKYTPTNGCDNCWGDLYQGCTEQCKREFREALEFGKDLWSLVRTIYPKTELSQQDTRSTQTPTKGEQENAPNKPS